MSVTKRVVIGPLWGDPEEKNGLVTFTLYNKCANGEDGETNFERIWVSGKLAGVAMKHLKRGTLCCVEGESVTINKKVSMHAQNITFLSLSDYRRGINDK